MSCREIMNRFLTLDNISRIPDSIKFHMDLCPRCRRDIDMLVEKLVLLRKSSPFRPDSNFGYKVMQQIRAADVQIAKRISNLKWIIVGAVLLISMFLFPFSNSSNWLKTYFGAQFQIPLSLVLGLIMSIYAIIFIGTHTEELKDFFRLKKLH